MTRFCLSTYDGRGEKCKLASHYADRDAIVIITTPMTPHAGNKMNHFAHNIQRFMAFFISSHFLCHLCPTSSHPPLFLCSLGRCQRVCVRVCERACVCGCCVDLLLEEVAGHKSQLMSITLIRSSIHPRAQGPIHPSAFHTHGPQEPRAHSHSRTLTEVNCQSLKTS